MSSISSESAKRQKYETHKFERKKKNNEAEKDNTRSPAAFLLTMLLKLTLHRFQQCAVPASSFDFSFLGFHALNFQSVIGVSIRVLIPSTNTQLHKQYKQISNFIILLHT